MPVAGLSAKPTVDGKGENKMCSNPDCKGCLTRQSWHQPKGEKEMAGSQQTMEQDYVNYARTIGRMAAWVNILDSLELPIDTYDRERLVLVIQTMREEVKTYDAVHFTGEVAKAEAAESNRVLSA